MKKPKLELLSRIKFDKPIVIKDGERTEMKYSIDLESGEGKLISFKKIDKTNK